MRFEVGIFLMAGLSVSGPLLWGDCAPARGANPSCDINLDRETPSSPLPIRLDRNATATIIVTKRPLEKIQFDATYADVVQPDPFVTIFQAFITPLKAVTIGTSLSGNPTGNLRTFLGTRPTLGPWQPILDELAAIESDQDAAGKNLAAVKTAIDAAGNDLKDLQKISANCSLPPACAKPATPPKANEKPDALEVIRKKVMCEMIAGQTLSPSPLGCPPDQVGAAVQPAAAGAITILDDSVKQAIKDFEAVREVGTPIPGARDKALAALNETVYRQSLLDGSLKSIQTAQAALVQAAAVLQQLTGTVMAAPGQQLFSVTAVKGTNRTATIKISALDLMSTGTTLLATVTITWGSTRWETSTGVLFSTLENRSFQNTAIIINGQPQLDGGKPDTVITETTTRPSVIPALFAHFRAWDGAPHGNRFAFLVTGVVGVNPVSGTADFGGGITLSYRNFMFSPLAHFGRDLRLTNGLAVGQQLGTSFPPLTTERYWVPKFAIGISYRVPI